VDVASLISGTYPIEDAADVYSRLGAGSLEGIGFLLSYGPAPDAESPERTIQISTHTEPAAASQPRTPRSADVRIGFVGAGNYATSMLLPHLRDSSEVELVSVATTKSLSGLNAQRKFGFATITTSVEAVLDDDTLDAVFIVTRHHSHAGLVCEALKRGRAVFVEKPLALSEDQLAQVLETVNESGNDRIMVGFNRRFAPLFTDLQNRLTPFRSPLSARYLVNAGRLDPSSWYLNEELEGSRFAGEGGHFIDTVSALVGRDPVEVQAMAAGANIHATLRYSDESVATISYVTDGSPRFPKETLDVSADGRTGRLDNFQRITAWSSKGKTGRRTLTGQDKGQRAQLERFVHAVRTGSAMPIPLESLVATTRATLAVAQSVATRQPVTL
jgi:predicted dehydrogenase